MIEPRPSPRRDLRALPKAHLHLHLEGAMRPATLAELAERSGATAPIVDGSAGFAAFSAAYRAAWSLLTSAEDYWRLLREVAEDAAADGAVWIEPALVLTPAGAQRLGLEVEEEFLEIALAGARDAEQATGVGIGLMLAGNRTHPLENSLRQAQIAGQYAGRGVVAFGLLDDESAFPPEPFAEAFAVARGAGLICAPHAGELAGAASVRGALEALGAHRIQHGVRAIEDPALLERLAKQQVCLDVCPTSNLLLSVVPALADHPLPELLAAGVPVSINSDDPLFFGSSLLQEYELCRSVFGLEDAALAQIAARSIQASGAPDHLKRAALAGIDRWLAED